MIAVFDEAFPFISGAFSIRVEEKQGYNRRRFARWCIADYRVFRHLKPIWCFGCHSVRDVHVCVCRAPPPAMSISWTCDCCRRGSRAFLVDD